MKINYSKFIPCLIFPLIVGLTSSLFSAESIPTWYNSLNKPFLNPPNWVFGPVWTVLFLSMGLSYYLFIETKTKSSKTLGNVFFYLQLAANFLWSLIFFNLQSPFFAFLDIILMIILISLNIYFFYRLNKTSGLILIPYLLWVGFASYLNIGIWLLNR